MKTNSKHSLVEIRLLPEIIGRATSSEQFDKALSALIRSGFTPGQQPKQLSGYKTCYCRFNTDSQGSSGDNAGRLLYRESTESVVVDGRKITVRRIIVFRYLPHHEFEKLKKVPRQSVIHKLLHSDNKALRNELKRAGIAVNKPNSNHVKQIKTHDWFCYHVSTLHHYDGAFIVPANQPKLAYLNNKEQMQQSEMALGQCLSLFGPAGAGKTVNMVLRIVEMINRMQLIMPTPMRTKACVLAIFPTEQLRALVEKVIQNDFPTYASQIVCSTSMDCQRGSEKEVKSFSRWYNKTNRTNKWPKKFSDARESFMLIRRKKDGFSYPQDHNPDEDTKSLLAAYKQFNSREINSVGYEPKYFPDFSSIKNQIGDKYLFCCVVDEAQMFPLESLRRLINESQVCYTKTKNAYDDIQQRQSTHYASLEKGMTTDDSKKTLRVPEMQSSQSSVRHLFPQSSEINEVMQTVFAYDHNQSTIADPMVWRRGLDQMLDDIFDREHQKQFLKTCHRCPPPVVVVLNKILAMLRMVVRGSRGEPYHEIQPVVDDKNVQRCFFSPSLEHCIGQLSKNKLSPFDVVVINDQPVDAGCYPTCNLDSMRGDCANVIVCDLNGFKKYTHEVLNTLAEECSNYNYADVAIHRRKNKNAPLTRKERYASNMLREIYTIISRTTQYIIFILPESMREGPFQHHVSAVSVNRFLHRTKANKYPGIVHAQSIITIIKHGNMVRCLALMPTIKFKNENERIQFIVYLKQQVNLPDVIRYKIFILLMYFFFLVRDKNQKKSLSLTNQIIQCVGNEKRFIPIIIAYFTLCNNRHRDCFAKMQPWLESSGVVPNNRDPMESILRENKYLNAETRGALRLLSDYHQNRKSDPNRKVPDSWSSHQATIAHKIAKVLGMENICHALTQNFSSLRDLISNSGVLDHYLSCHQNGQLTEDYIATLDETTLQLWIAMAGKLEHKNEQKIFATELMRRWHDSHKPQWLEYITTSASGKSTLKISNELDVNVLISDLIAFNELIDNHAKSKSLLKSIHKLLFTTLIIRIKKDYNKDHPSSKLMNNKLYEGVVHALINNGDLYKKSHSKIACFINNYYTLNNNVKNKINILIANLERRQEQESARIMLATMQKPEKILNQLHATLPSLKKLLSGSSDTKEASPFHAILQNTTNELIADVKHNTRQKKAVLGLEADDNNNDDKKENRVKPCSLKKNETSLMRQGSSQFVDTISKNNDLAYYRACYAQSDHEFTNALIEIRQVGVWHTAVSQYITTDSQMELKLFPKDTITYHSDNNPRHQLLMHYQPLAWLYIIKKLLINMTQGINKKFPKATDKFELQTSLLHYAMATKDAAALSDDAKQCINFCNFIKSIIQDYLKRCGQDIHIVYLYYHLPTSREQADHLFNMIIHLAREKSHYDALISVLPVLFDKSLRHIILQKLLSDVNNKHTAFKRIEKPIVTITVSSPKYFITDNLYHIIVFLGDLTHKKLRLHNSDLTITPDQKNAFEQHHERLLASHYALCIMEKKTWKKVFDSIRLIVAGNPMDVERDGLIALIYTLFNPHVQQYKSKQIQLNDTNLSGYIDLDSQNEIDQSLLCLSLFLDNTMPSEIKKKILEGNHPITLISTEDPKKPWVQCYYLILMKKHPDRINDIIQYLSTDLAKYNLEGSFVDKVKRLQRSSHCKSLLSGDAKPIDSDALPTSHQSDENDIDVDFKRELVLYFSYLESHSCLAREYFYNCCFIGGDEGDIRSSAEAWSIVLGSLHKFDRRYYNYNIASNILLHNPDDIRSPCLQMVGYIMAPSFEWKFNSDDLHSNTQIANLFYYHTLKLLETRKWCVTKRIAFVSKFLERLTRHFKQVSSNEKISLSKAHITHAEILHLVTCFTLLKQINSMIVNQQPSANSDSLQRNIAQIITIIKESKIEPDFMKQRLLWDFDSKKMTESSLTEYDNFVQKLADDNPERRLLQNDLVALRVLQKPASKNKLAQYALQKNRTVDQKNNEFEQILTYLNVPRTIGGVMFAISNNYVVFRREERQRSVEKTKLPTLKK